MSFPTVADVNGGNSDAYTDTHTVNLPADISAGNLLLVFFGSGETDGETAVISFPVGWTQLFQVAPFDGYFTFGAWYRVADGGEGASITVTTDVKNYGSAHTSYRITGHGGSVEAGTATDGDSDKYPDPPNLSPTWGAQDTLWFACCCHSEGDDALVAYPTNYTDGRNDRDGQYSPGLGVARRELNAASENPGTFETAFIRKWAANTIAIRPAILWEKSISDTVGIADSLSKSIGASKADTIAMADSRSKAIGVQKADTVSIADVFAFMKARYLYLSDTIGITDSHSKEIGVSKADTIAIADSFSKVSEFNRVLADTVTITDIANFLKTINLHLSDTIAISDSTSKSISVSKADLVAIADAIAKAIGIPKADSIAITDEEAKIIGKALEDTIIITDGEIPIGKLFVPPGIYIVELHDSTGGLVSILEKVYSLSYEQEVNVPHILEFKIPADDPKLTNVTLANEFWLRSLPSGDVVRKFKLKHQIDIRDDKLHSRITGQDYFSTLTDIVFDYEAGTYMNYVATTPATLSNPIASDDTHFYVADNVNYRVKKYLKSDMSYVAQSAALAGTITAMAVDDTHVYFAMDADPVFYIYQYTKTPFSFVGTTPGTGGIMKAIALDDTYFYAGGQTQVIRKYKKSDRTWVADSPDYGGVINALATDGTHVYACGQTNKRVKKYLCTTLAYVTQSTLYGNTLDALVADDTYIYTGGETTQKVWKLNKSDLTLVDESSSYGGDILALAQYGDYVYAGGYTAETIKRYSKDTLLLHDISPVYGAIYALTVDATHIYAVGTGFVAVKKYSLFDTVEDVVEELLSYQVNVPAVTLGTIAPAYADLVRDIQANGETIAEVLLNLRDIVGGYIEVNNDRELDWHETIGEDKGQQIRYKKNLIGIEREIDWTGLANRIYAYGRSTSGTKISLSEIQAEDYVEDIPSQTAWGGIYAKSFVAFDITEAETLLAYANTRLDELKNPPISYNIKSVDLSAQAGFSFEKLLLGSIVKVTDEDLNIDIEAQVVRIRHPDLSNPLEMDVEIATVVRDITHSIGDMKREVTKHQNILAEGT